MNNHVTISPSRNSVVKITAMKEIKKVSKKNLIKGCPPEKVLNPATNRCIKKDGALAKKLKLV